MKSISQSLLSLLLVSHALNDAFAFMTPIATQKRALILSSPSHGLATNTIQWAQEADTLETETTASANVTAVTETEEEETKEGENEVEKLFRQIKESGTAGAISLGLWEGAFWFVSIPVSVLGFQQVTGHFPDFSDKEDLGKLGAEAFAFVNFARFAVPLRVGLALASVPWVQENIVDVFLNKDDNEDEDKNEEEELEVVMDFSAEETKEDVAEVEPVIQEEAEEEEKPKRRWLGRLVPGFLRKKSDD